jgi:hypothetical protein
VEGDEAPDFIDSADSADSVTAAAGSAPPRSTYPRATSLHAAEDPAQTALTEATADPGQRR